MSTKQTLASRIDSWLTRAIGDFARPVALIGALVAAASTMLPWTFDSSFSVDLTVSFYPAGPQVFLLVLSILLVILLLWRPRGANSAVRAGSVWALAIAVITAIGIVDTLGGLVNIDIGGWLAIAGSLVLVAGARALPADKAPTLRLKVPEFVELLVVVALLGGGLVALAYELNTDDSTVFVTFLVLIGGIVVAARHTGVLGWLQRIMLKHRRVTILAAFIAATLFPFTQGGSEANMSIANQVLIFAAVAMGLNIVVGLAGLLDLGYVAFLGIGAFTAAALSESAFATFFSWKPPFFIVALLGAAAAAAAGLLIGTPTLRVSGDYLAIVTLAFGEIFRLVMINLDGTDGPDITNGSNGIPAIPELSFFGFDFGESNTVFGVELGRFSNYYFLLLLLMAFVILVFYRVNNSRIGRGWVAIREDEIAAESMGISTFGLKLLAFSLGAFLAGLAGTVKAHQDVSVTPDQYVFLESAFLLAAIVLGGMGTITGVLLGATILKLFPEKLRFFDEYRLMLFGALLVLMMRFRPEGLVPSTRRRLEFHEEDEELAEEVDESIAAGEVAR